MQTSGEPGFNWLVDAKMDGIIVHDDDDELHGLQNTQ